MDRFSKVMPGLVYELLWRWIPKFQRKSPDESNLAYNDAVVLRYTFWFTAFVAALLPLVSLAILTYCALSQGAQIAVIGAFTSLAALCLAWLTEADRKDIFLITSM